jgi:hypothetical protein
MEKTEFSVAVITKEEYLSLAGKDLISPYRLKEFTMKVMCREDSLQVLKDKSLLRGFIDHATMLRRKENRCCVFAPERTFT